ncbi:MAG TPA: tetratricopeptide repeat protein, partial [Anaerolineales bacterium]|nr:tetratricopeptide repeat protein [Anaerolineales bacterium]
VFFVPLAPLASGDLIVFAIAEALKFTFYRRDQPKTQLLNYLHEKTVLLVMDNFEHLTETAGLIAEILAAAPQVKVLATSRERLNLRDEELFPVEGMRFPEANDNQGLDEFSAVKLFLQSARRTQPDFELVAQDRPCVARICRLVQGTPLGLELAAGWVRSLSCQEIANEIEASLDFLETNLRDLPDRHRSLRAVFDYSWVLLPENERFLLMQLAVFQGPFDRAGVEAVVRLPPAPRPARLLPLLTGLVDKSLLHRNINGTYDLHSLVRHYALEHLETDPADTLRTRLLHATHFLTLLQQQETSLQGPDQPKALALLTTCLDDIRAAWLWALSHGHWLLADGALESLYLFHNIKNREDAAARLFSESRALLVRRQDPTSAVLTLRLDVRFLLVSAALSRFETVRALLSPCLETAHRLGLQAEIARIHVAEGKIYWMEGDYPKSMAHEQKALALYRQLKAPVEVALCLDRLGTLAWSMGDYASALQLFEESLDMLRPVGAPTYIARLYDHLGVVARDRGDLKAAQGYFQESQQIIAGLDVPGQQAFMLNHLGGVFYMSGQVKEAVSLYEQSIALSREVGDQRALAYNLYDLANVVFDELSDTTRAEGLLAESLALFETLKEPFGIIITRISMATAAIVMNNKKAGLEMLQKSLQESLAIQNSRLTIEALQAYAQYFYQVQKIGEGLALVSFIMNMPNMEGEGNLPPRLVSFLDSARSQMSPEEFETHMARGRAYQIEALCAHLAQEVGE